MKLRDNEALFEELTVLVHGRDQRQHLGSRVHHIRAIVEIFERHLAKHGYEASPVNCETHGTVGPSCWKCWSESPFPRPLHLLTRDAPPPAPHVAGDPCYCRGGTNLRHQDGSMCPGSIGQESR